MITLVLLLTACGKVVLYGQLSEREANDMLALLLRSGIEAEKTVAKTGATISVPPDRVPDAMSVLDAAGLPRSRFTNMGELFQREGLVSSPAEERVRYIYGITQELSRTLTTIDGVLDARVHVVMPENDPISGRQSKPATAAVLIRYAPNTAIDSIVPKIKELVSNSIEGMSYDRVSVVMVRAAAEPLPPPVKESSAPAPSPLVMVGSVVLGISVLANLAALGMFLWKRRKREAGTLAAAS